MRIELWRRFENLIAAAALGIVLLIAGTCVQRHAHAQTPPKHGTGYDVHRRAGVLPVSQYLPCDRCAAVMHPIDFSVHPWGSGTGGSIYGLFDPARFNARYGKSTCGLFAPAGCDPGALKRWRWLGFDNELGSLYDSAEVWACQHRPDLLGNLPGEYDCVITGEEATDARAANDQALVNAVQALTQPAPPAPPPVVPPPPVIAAPPAPAPAACAAALAAITCSEAPGPVISLPPGDYRVSSSSTGRLSTILLPAEPERLVAGDSESAAGDGITPECAAPRHNPLLCEPTSYGFGYAQCSEQISWDCCQGHCGKGDPEKADACRPLRGKPRPACRPMRGHGRGVG